MVAYKKVLKYLTGRKTGATRFEMVSALEINDNTLRKVLGSLKKAHAVTNLKTRKCRETGKRGLKVYGI